ncbi:MAG: T9SS type A sorting domain-containing protein [Saprospiraceae bacterium]
MIKLPSFILLLLSMPALLLSQLPGDLDPSFTSSIGSDGYIWSFDFQPEDGSILIGGEFTTYNGQNARGICRLTPDGDIDPSFYSGTGFSGNVFAITHLENGKALVAGNFSTYNGQNAVDLVQLNQDGSIDTEFTGWQGTDGTIWAIALQPDGKILIGGFFNKINDESRKNLARLNQDGSLDLTFFADCNDWVRTIAVQNDERILIGGDFQNVNGSESNFIARIYSDGSVDPTFMDGFGFDAQLRQIDIQPNGKIIAVGGFSEYNFNANMHITRINPDGTPDFTFDTGQGPKGWILCCEAQPDGRILIGGDFTEYWPKDDFRFSCVLPDGSIEPGFNGGLGPNNTVRLVKSQNAQKAIIAGNFTSYDNSPVGHIARIYKQPISSIGNPSTSGQVTLQPNPVQDYLHIQVSDDHLIQTLEVFNNLGLKMPVHSPSYEKNMIDVSNYPSGIYHLKLSTKSSTYTKVFIKN